MNLITNETFNYILMSCFQIWTMDSNLTEANLTTVSTVEGSTCSGADDYQLSWYLNFAWWIEGFLQLVTGT